MTASVMQPIDSFDAEIHTGRILIFCPTYPAGHEMRMRIIDSGFVRFADEITHFVPLAELEPNHEPTVYEEHGYADRTDYLESLSEEFEINLDVVQLMADVLGPSEDFDGLVTALEDGERYV